MSELRLPLTEKVVRKLKVGDTVFLSGTIITARDLAHKHLMHKDIPGLSPMLKSAVIYHCGPIVRKLETEYKFLAAGPTTSMREEPYMATLIKKYQLRGIIGKGGMGEDTLKALSQEGCVYFQAIGGTAALIASCVARVVKVFMLEEFGVPEALWVIEVERLPLLVTMDTHKQSIHQTILEQSRQKRAGLLA